LDQKSLDKTQAAFHGTIGSPALAQSRDGDIRIGPILAIPALLAELGVKPQRAFTRARVSLRQFRDPDSRLPLEQAARLVQVSAELTGCPHFALLLGDRFDMTGFGPLGELMRHSPNVGAALRSLVLHLHLHDRGAAPLLLSPDERTAILGYSVYRQGTPAIEQIYDAAIAIANKILLNLCGRGFRPAAVQFSYRRPKHTAAYRRLFGGNVTFDAEVSGIVFASSWLSRPIEGADASVHRALSSAIRDAQASGSLSFGEHVEIVLRQMLLSGHATADAVSTLFGISERTLRRRLGDEGKSFQNLVNKTRFELACQLLRNTRLPVAAIASALQYLDANAFSRAFGNWAQCTPSAWRANSHRA